MGQHVDVHLVVDAAAGWHEAAERRLKREGAFAEVKIRAPQREGYGALVTRIDPRVLLHLAR